MEIVRGWTDKQCNLIWPHFVNQLICTPWWAVGTESVRMISCWIHQILYLKAVISPSSPAGSRDDIKSSSYNIYYELHNSQLGTSVERKWKMGLTRSQRVYSALINKNQSVQSRNAAMGRNTADWVLVRALYLCGKKSAWKSTQNSRTLRPYKKQIPWGKVCAFLLSSNAKPHQLLTPKKCPGKYFVENFQQLKRNCRKCLLEICRMHCVGICVLAGSGPPHCGVCRFSQIVFRLTDFCPFVVSFLILSLLDQCVSFISVRVLQNERTSSGTPPNLTLTIGATSGKNADSGFYGLGLRPRDQRAESRFGSRTSFARLVCRHDWFWQRSESPSIFFHLLKKFNSCGIPSCHAPSWIWEPQWKLPTSSASNSLHTPPRAQGVHRMKVKSMFSEFRICCSCLRHRRVDWLSYWRIQKEIHLGNEAVEWRDA